VAAPAIPDKLIRILPRRSLPSTSLLKLWQVLAYINFKITFAMKRVKHIMTAVAVFAVVGTSLGLSANAKRASLCLYQRNGNMCPITRIVNNGITAVPNAFLRTNNGACPSSTPLTNCNKTVFVNIEP
jgi:hypothetical protein